MENTFRIIIIKKKVSNILRETTFRHYFNGGRRDLRNNRKTDDQVLEDVGPNIGTCPVTHTMTGEKL